MNIDPDDQKYLLGRIRLGEAMLVLGSGASATSRNALGDPIKGADALSALLASKAGLPYENESLVDVLGAVRGTLSDVDIRNIYAAEYKDCQPSDELKALFSYVWRRVYTWNIDDTLENVNRKFLQSRRFYNGMIDKAVEFEGFNVIHLVHLHGEIAKPEHNFIFTEKDYALAIKNDRHFWYQRAAQDYLATCPIFIGSKLSEPILVAELERAKREGDLVAGRAFSITPDKLTPIQIKNLRSKGISHICGTLEDFSRWLAINIPGGWSPVDVVSAKNRRAFGEISGITTDEISAAHSLREIELSQLKAKLASLQSTEANGFARDFLQGYPPTWEIAASDIPVRLEGYDSLESAFRSAMQKNDKLFVVTGQAGSGKTTATMSTLLKVSENDSLQLYHMRPDIKSVRRAISLLKKIRRGKVILYVGDLFVYGDTFASELDFFSGEEIIIVTTARTGEWREHFARYLGSKAEVFQFQRFVRADFGPLVDRLTRFVPAPTFRALSQEKQFDRLARSNNQLLIALREATGSENFNVTISQEYRKLPDADTRRLFIVAGLATLARVGVSIGVAKEAFKEISETRTFEKALDALAGIVTESFDGRLQGRHDLYVRHLFDKEIGFEEIKLCIKALLKTYRKYNIPIIRSVNRLDALLFKALLNHHFVYNQARHLRVPSEAVDIYEDFEVDFQLDGHFWLQYGLFLANCGLIDGAIKNLARSIEAYPDNAFAVHALADVQLRAAKRAKTFDHGTRDLIAVAVRTLNAQDSQTGLELDVYPIVTLAYGHVGALVAHDQLDEARECAQAYFNRIQLAQRRVNANILQQAGDKLMKFVTLGEWTDKAVNFPNKSCNRGRGRAASKSHLKGQRH